MTDMIRMTIDISEPVRAICDAFGHKPDRVAKIEIRPEDAELIVYEVNENGVPFVRESTGHVAAFIVKHKVRT